MFHTQTNSFSMFFPSPNHNHNNNYNNMIRSSSSSSSNSFDDSDHDYMNMNMYSSSSSPPHHVDCTLSLATPSTRRSQDSCGGGDRPSNGGCGGGGGSRGHKFCWQSKTTAKNNKSNDDGRTISNEGNYYNNNYSHDNYDPLLARRCANCDTTSTPLWRNGPRGPKSLCNACGIRYKKEERRAKAKNANNNNMNVTTATTTTMDYYNNYYANNQNTNTWVETEEMHYYASHATSEFRFTEDDGNSYSWKFNVAHDRPSLVRDY